MQSRDSERRIRESFYLNTWATFTRLFGFFTFQKVMPQPVFHSPCTLSAEHQHNPCIHRCLLLCLHTWGQPCFSRIHKFLLRLILSCPALLPAALTNSVMLLKQCSESDCLHPGGWQGHTWHQTAAFSKASWGLWEKEGIADKQTFS